MFYDLQLIDSTTFMESSLSDLVNNLSVNIPGFMELNLHQNMMIKM